MLFGKQGYYKNIANRLIFASKFIQILNENSIFFIPLYKKKNLKKYLKKIEL